MYAAEYPLSQGDRSFPSSSLINPLSSASPLLHGGPQFGKRSKAKSKAAFSFPGFFPSLHKTNIRLIAIFFTVILISILWVRSYQPSQLLVHLTNQTAALRNIPAIHPGTQAPAGSPGATLELKGDGTTVVLPNSQIDVITQQAKAGDSITRLARYALTQHLQDISLTLTPEQRIYAEDFVQKSTGSTIIRTGQKLSFATNLLDQAIQKAQALTPAQAHHLSKYSARVKF